MKKRKKKNNFFFPLPSKTVGCFSGRLMSAASDQKMFCKLCSPFCCSFGEFVEEKVISPSYSSALIGRFSSMLLVKALSRVWLFETPGIATCQAPSSIGFSRQEYWSGLPFPSPGDLPNQGIQPGSPAL